MHPALALAKKAIEAGQFEAAWVFLAKAGRMLGCGETLLKAARLVAAIENGHERSNRANGIRCYEEALRHLSGERARDVAAELEELRARRPGGPIGYEP